MIYIFKLSRCRGTFPFVYKLSKNVVPLLHRKREAIFSSPNNIPVPHVLRNGNMCTCARAILRRTCIGRVQQERCVFIVLVRPRSLSLVHQPKGVPSGMLEVCLLHQNITAPSQKLKGLYYYISFYSLCLIILKGS